MEVVTVINRTNEKLEYMFDGQTAVFPVGESHHDARAARLSYSKLIRNLDPNTFRATHLIGIKGETDCSMLDVGKKPDTEELLDRSKMTTGKTESRKVGGAEIQIERGGFDSGMVGATGSADSE